MKKLTHGSVFTGVGGFEVGADRAGIKTLWNCEIEQYNRNVLEYKWPKVPQYDDIRTMRNPRYVDIISGGFPCQDISVAGTMAGINGARSGLWSQMYRICREVGPRYIIIENSPALLIRGFETVLCNLSEIGYNAQWQCIRNSAFGYPHKRERLYVIAYSGNLRQKENFQDNGGFNSIFRPWTSNFDCGNTLSQGIYKTPDYPYVRNGDGVRYWTQRIGSVGNAVNPTLAHYLFDCIEKFDVAA